MRTLARYALSITTAALFAGCGGSPGVTPQASALAARTNSTSYNLLYGFGKPPDGNAPVANLIDLDGTLYGTTSQGGTHSCYISYGNLCGTVFSITTAGTEQVMHSFGNGTDGAFPVASLIKVKGKLYGTTEYGSHRCDYPYLGCGTVFTITTGGTEKVLHSFDVYARDGALPEAPLIDVKGTLYGTTAGGGTTYCRFGLYALCGTVFSITPDGTERVMHDFTGTLGTDGASPDAGLIHVRGTLYGTTRYGGGGGSSVCGYGCGTIFSISTSGTEKVLHSFAGGLDGAYPRAALTDVNGTLYGTTSEGGRYKHGTVFSIRPNGTEKVIHSFGNGTDGRYPVASLIEVNGTLYGTTYDGGAFSDGTIFSITPDGTEQVVHSFGSGTDGFWPAAGLTNVSGTLYGTTQSGGPHGGGTVFALTP
jgi:uncharacterized repeat protein (TIGR03803 family)